MGAPKGNKFALGITESGRPPVYESEFDLKEKLIEYFESLQPDTKADPPKQAIKPTMSGMALFLGFASRQSMYDYASKKEFSYIIKRAQLVIAENYETMLDSKSSTGAIFALKNMGWKDKSEVEQTVVGGEKVVINFKKKK